MVTQNSQKINNLDEILSSVFSLFLLNKKYSEIFLFQNNNIHYFKFNIKNNKIFYINN